MSIWGKAQNTVTYAANEVDQNFDDDSDGWTNLGESLSGTDPQLGSSFPPGESPQAAVSSAGGMMQGSTSVAYDMVGAAVHGPSSQSANYSIDDGFVAYQ